MFELSLAKKKVLSTLLGQMLSGNNRSHTNAIQVTQSCFKNTGNANYSSAESNFLCHCNPQEQVKITCYSNHNYIKLLYQNQHLKPREEFSKISQFIFKVADKATFVRVNLQMKISMIFSFTKNLYEATKSTVWSKSVQLWYGGSPDQELWGKQKTERIVWIKKNKNMS